MNTWVLAVHLPEIAKSARDPHVREMAQRCLDHYKYPVDAQVFSPSGELRDHVGANEHPDLDRYWRLLESVF